MRTPFTPVVTRRPVPVRRPTNPGVSLMIAGCVCLAVGLSVLGYSAHQWQQMKRRLAASVLLLEASGREVEASRRLALEIDEWSLARSRE